MLTSKEIEVKGNKVSYYDEGHGDVPVIFIHGFPFSKETWKEQIAAVAPTHRAIAYDVRGHGASEAGTATFSVPQFADDLLSLMDALLIQEAVICGLSMGGYIALHAVEKQPERIAGLLLCDTQCAADTEEGRQKRMKTIAFIKKNGLKEYADESVKNLFAPQSLTENGEQVNFIRNLITNTKAESICLTLQALADRKEKCSILDQIKVPAEIIVGREDKVTPVAAAQKMHDLIPASQLRIIERAGHLSNLENPSDFNETIKAFLTAHF